VIADVLEQPTDEGVQTRARARVSAICDRFPLYPWLRSSVTDPSPHPLRRVPASP
jgi:hypothetical protein